MLAVFSCIFYNDLNSGGGPIEPNGDISYISAPPLSVVTSQEMVENTVGSTTTMILERELYGISASVRKQSITLHLFDMLTQIDSVTSRKFCVVKRSLKLGCFISSCL